MANNQIIETVKKMCAEGKHIFSVRKDKRPATPHGFKDATNNPDEFLKFYKEGYGIGLATGKINDTYVLDFDVEKDENNKPIIKDGKPINTGEVNFIDKFVNEENGNQYKTRIIKTQSGGKQLYFKLGEGQEPLNSHISFLPKVDFKGDGGYVVAPPTQGEYGEYKVFMDVPIAPIPDNLYQYLHTLETPESGDSIEYGPKEPLNLDNATIKNLTESIAEIFKKHDGRGNEKLMAISGTFAYAGIPIEKYKKILRDASKINDYKGKIDFGVVDRSYKKVIDGKKATGYTTLRKILTETKDEYMNFDELIESFDNIFSPHPPDKLLDIITDKPEGNWAPIEFKNGIPARYAGWYNGNPYIRKITLSKERLPNIILQKITLKNTDIKNLEKQIKRIKVDKDDMIEFRGEVFAKSDFVNLMVYPSNVNYFTECLNALPIDNKKYMEPKLYIENGIIKFPENYYARHDYWYQKNLVESLNIGKVDLAIYDEAIKLLSKHPKQLTLHYAIIGANIINVIGQEDYLYTIDAIGESDSGKSFAIDITLEICYGIFGDKAKLQNDAIASNFRQHTTVSSTNLPVYTEEVVLYKNSLMNLKSKGSNIRGHPDQSVTTYGDEATLIFSRNTESDDAKNIDPIEKKAQDKRILKFVFESDDVITDNTEKIQGADFLKKIKNLHGGLLYEKLKTKLIKDILAKYRELKTKETKPEFVVSLLGAWIMDNTDFIPIITEIKAPTMLDEFFGKILDTWYRINGTQYDENGKRRLNFEDELMQTNLVIDEIKHNFKLSVTGFNQIKKTFGYTKHASDFAKSFGFEYKNTKIFSVLFKSVTGKIPDEFFELKINNQNIEDEITDDEIKKQIDSLGL